MIFLAASFPEFLQFLKIVLWISIPLFLISTGITVFWHYYKKRKETLTDLLGLSTEMNLSLEPATVATEPNHAGSFLFRQQYHQQLQYGREQYALLEKNFRQVKNNYAALLAGSDGEGSSSDEPASNAIQKQLKQYELKIVQLQQALDYLQKNAANEENLEKAHALITEKEQEIKRLQLITEQLNKEIGLLNQQNDSRSQELQKMDQQLREFQETARQATADARELKLSVQQQNEDRDKNHFEENKRLNEQLMQLHESFRKLGEENNHLQVKLQESRLEQGVPGESEKRVSELQNALIKSEQEILEWKNKLADAGSLNEIVEEKKSQIDFLQNQLEQRIRSNHQTEQRNQENLGQLIQLREEVTAYQQAFDLHQEESNRLQQELSRLYGQIEEGTAENRQLKQDLLSKEDSVVNLEAEITKAFKRINDFEEENNRNKSMAFDLEIQLTNAQKHIALLENKLTDRQSLLNRLHQELGALLDSNHKANNKAEFPYSLPHLVEEAH